MKFKLCDRLIEYSTSYGENYKDLVYETKEVENGILVSWVYKGEEDSSLYSKFEVEENIKSKDWVEVE